MKKFTIVLLICLGCQLAGAELLVFGNKLYFLPVKSNSVKVIGSPNKSIPLPNLPQGIWRYRRTNSWEYVTPGTLDGFYARKLNGGSGWKKVGPESIGFSPCLGQYMYLSYRPGYDRFKISQIEGTKTLRTWKSDGSAFLSGDEIAFKQNYKTLVTIGKNGRPVAHTLPRALPKEASACGVDGEVAFFTTETSVYQYNFYTHKLTRISAMLRGATLVVSKGLYFCAQAGNKVYLERWKQSSLSSIELPASSVRGVLIDKDDSKVRIAIQAKGSDKLFTATINGHSHLRLKSPYWYSGFRDVNFWVVWHNHLWVETLDVNNNGPHSTLHKLP